MCLPLQIFLSTALMYLLPVSVAPQKHWTEGAWRQTILWTSGSTYSHYQCVCVCVILELIPHCFLCMWWKLGPQSSHTALLFPFIHLKFLWMYFPSKDHCDNILLFTPEAPGCTSAMLGFRFQQTYSSLFLISQHSTAAFTWEILSNCTCCF